MKMKILGTEVRLGDDYHDIHDLIFYRDNPRVYACTHSVPDFEELTQDEQQLVIFEKLKEQESFKSLLPDVRRHGGLMESILVRWDTREVVEGNSRLAVYRYLADDDDDGDGEWDLIPCNIASALTDEQMAAFLSQVHIKGKTKWSAYEKANFAYVRRQAGWSVPKIAEHVGESPSSVHQRIRVVERMKSNRDSNLQHFSFYEVIERNSVIKQEVDGTPEFSDFLLSRIRSFDTPEEENLFTAQELRDKLPRVIQKPKVLKALVAGSIDLDEAHERARISRVEETVRKARGLLEDVSRRHVRELDKPRYNAFKQDVRRLTKEVERISKMVEEHTPS